MKNRPISVFLHSLGISGAEQQTVARAVLEDENFTNPRKTNMAVHKEAAAEESLRQRLAFHCAIAACRDTLELEQIDAESPRQLLLVERDACEVCGGSADRRALNEMATAMTAAGLSRVVVVGGTKQKADRILELSPPSIQWRFVDALVNVNRRAADSDLKWGDVILIWAGTPLPHRVSNLFGGRDTITVPTTGIAALAREAAEFARNRTHHAVSRTAKNA